MGSIWLILTAVVLFIAAYIFYGGYLARTLGVDPGRRTPAHTMGDGIDYVPAKAPVLLGHHFASIAGAAPIIGPIVAAAFGWVPVMLWILIGGIFMGAVHDFTSLIASIRHEGRSIGEVIEDEIGRRAKFFFLLFTWSTLILVIAVFIIIVGKTFEEIPASASASVLFIAAAVTFGLILYRYKMSLLPATFIGLILLSSSIYAGYLFPVKLPALYWYGFLIVYIFIASVIPVWLLLQPRDYLNSFILYALIALGLGGIVFMNPAVQIPAFTSFEIENLGYMFPILFVTVACGAISGFHSLVASGTSSKQLNNEKDAKLVGYGGMLIESALGVVALITAAVLVNAEYTAMKGNPIALFSHSLGTMTTVFGIDYETGKTFASLAVSAFALTSLDTATRLARYAMEEFFYRPGVPKEKQMFLSRNRYAATFISVALAGALVVSGQGLKLWPIFGAANQLLAALALLAVTVWLSRHKKSNWFVKIPMIVMFMITLTALAIMAHYNTTKGNYVLAAISAILFVLAAFLSYEARRNIKRPA